MTTNIKYVLLEMLYNATYDKLAEALYGSEWDETLPSETSPQQILEEALDVIWRYKDLSK